MLKLPRPFSVLPWPLGFLLLTSSQAQEPVPPPTAAPAAYSLKVSEAKYRPLYGGVEFSFEFTNPTNEPVYLDCQGLPVSALSGKTLALSFGDKPDSASHPQRIGPRQTFAGYRRVDKVEPPRDPASPAGFSLLQVDMAVYPERSQGEGEPFLREQANRARSNAETVSGGGRKAVAPPPRTRTRIRRPAP